MWIACLLWLPVTGAQQFALNPEAAVYYERFQPVPRTAPASSSSLLETYAPPIDGGTNLVMAGHSTQVDHRAMVTASNSEDPLDAALLQIKDDVVLEATDLKHELEWIKEVDVMLASYQAKKTKVTTDVEDLRGKLKVLLKKKRQLENLKIQQQLQTQLESARADLGTLDGALSAVEDKQSEFVVTKSDVEATISKISGALETLQGEEAKSEAAKGATGAASGDAAALLAPFASK